MSGPAWLALVATGAATALLVPGPATLAPPVAVPTRAP